MHPATDLPHNLYMRQHWRQQSPGIKGWQGEVEYWILGGQFRMVDHAGRYLYELLPSPSRGLGYMPRTLEEIMDLNSRIKTDTIARRPTEVVFGDEKETAWLTEHGEEGRSIDVTQVAGLREQLMAKEWIQQLHPGKEVQYAGTIMMEYRGILTGELDGHPYRNTCLLRIVNGCIHYAKVQAEESSEIFLEIETLERKAGEVEARDLIPDGTH
jgi:hypothetical protein